MNDKLFGLPKSSLVALVTSLALACLSGISYIILQSIARPYWQIGTNAQIGGDVYHTILVINPGPWKTREPRVEFPQPSELAISDWSDGVTWENKINKINVFADSGLAPGGAFFILYKYSHNTNGEPIPKVMCDGKVCKSAPVFDLDLMMTFLLVGQGICVLASITLFGLFLHSRGQLVAERNSAINRALTELLAKEQGISDIRETLATMASLAENPFTGQIKPKSVRKVKRPGQ